MNERKSYARSVELGEVMVGGAVGDVVESRHSKFKTGDFVEGPLGWQEYALSDGAGPAESRSWTGSDFDGSWRVGDAGTDRLWRADGNRPPTGG